MAGTAIKRTGCIAELFRWLPRLHCLYYGNAGGVPGAAPAANSPVRQWDFNVIDNLLWRIFNDYAPFGLGPAPPPTVNAGDPVSAAGWNRLASTMNSYLSRNAIQVCQSITTSHCGNCKCNSAHGWTPNASPNGGITNSCHYPCRSCQADNHCLAYCSAGGYTAHHPCEAGYQEWIPAPATGGSCTVSGTTSPPPSTASGHYQWVCTKYGLYYTCSNNQCSPKSCIAHEVPNCRLQAGCWGVSGTAYNQINRCPYPGGFVAYQ